MKAIGLWRKVPAMDPWRIGLLIAAGIFCLFLLSKLRPRLPARQPPEPRASGPSERAERRAWRLVRRLPLAAQERLLARLERSLSEPNDDEEPAPPSSQDSP